MARVSFSIQHLVFCTSVEYPDVRRPYRDNILNGVDFYVPVPPGTEFPFEPSEFWLYVRLYSLADSPGDTRALVVTCSWLDAPDGNPVEVWRRDIGPVRFHHPRAVVDRAWAFRNYGDEARYAFPFPGRYGFRLWHRTRKWPFERTLRQEYVRVEVKS